MTNVRSRGWCFTINNPSGWDDIDIETMSSDAQYCIRGKELGPSIKQSSTAKKMAIGLNGETARVVQAGRRTNGKRSYNLQEEEPSKKLKTSILQSSYDIIQSYSAFVAQNVQLYSSLLKMNGGMEQPVPENRASSGSDSPNTTKNL